MSSVYYIRSKYSRVSPNILGYQLVSNLVDSEKGKETEVERQLPITTMETAKPAENVPSQIESKIDCRNEDLLLCPSKTSNPLPLTTKCEVQWTADHHWEP